MGQPPARPGCRRHGCHPAPRARTPVGRTSARSSEVAERQMRELSQQLVATQEEERKKLSRELHDHVGQMLTAMRMELGRIDRLRQGFGGPSDGPLARAVSRMPSARRQHGPHRSRSRAGVASEHARRLRSSACARMARPRFRAGASACPSSSWSRGTFEQLTRAAPHLRLPRRCRKRSPTASGTRKRRGSPSP